MVIAGLILAAVAALLHVYIFYLESVAWTSPRARAIFGTSAEEAETTKFLAFNQGFYNLFLALLVVVGLIVTAAGPDAVGLTLVFAGIGSMVAAAFVLFVSSSAHRAAALRQGVIPLLAVIVLAIGAAM